MNRGFVVLDFETTGLAHGRDRVIEIGAVALSEAFELEGTFETLVNPGRDVGPTRVHGISARDVFDAPAFDQVAPALIELLDGRVIVGHNVAFDLRFLAAELERDGYEIPEFVAIDTLQIARSILTRESLPSFKLKDLAEYFSLDLPGVMRVAGQQDRPLHSALGDAMLTANVLLQFARLSQKASFWDHHLEIAARVIWPDRVDTGFGSKLRATDANKPIPVAAAAPVPSEGSGASVSDVLAAVGAPAPAVRSTRAYSALLDHSLSDRILDPGEVDALVATAQALGLDGATLGSLHRGHFDDVVRSAWADGVLTDDERADIVRVAALLGIDGDSLGSALREPAVAESAAPAQPQTTAAGLPREALVVLTGDMTCERSIIEAEILALGYLIGKGVTKKTALVIAADPYTQSGKAKKARDYGIQVLGEEQGLALLRGL